MNIRRMKILFKLYEKEELIVNPLLASLFTYQMVSSLPFELQLDITPQYVILLT